MAVRRTVATTHASMPPATCAACRSTASGPSPARRLLVFERSITDAGWQRFEPDDERPAAAWRRDWPGSRTARRRGGRAQVVVVVREQRSAWASRSTGGTPGGAEHRGRDGARPRARSPAGCVRCASTSVASSARSGASTSATAAAAAARPARRDGGGRRVAAPRPVPVGDRPLHPAGQRGHHGVGQRRRRSAASAAASAGSSSGLASSRHADHAAPTPMRIRALSVFEGVVYHCWCVDPGPPGPADPRGRRACCGRATPTPSRGRCCCRSPTTSRWPAAWSVAGAVPRRAGRQGPDRRAPRRAPHHVPHLDAGARADASRTASEQLVEAAAAEAGEVEGDPAVAGRLHRRDDGLAPGDHPLEVGRRAPRCERPRRGGARAARRSRAARSPASARSTEAEAAERDRRAVGQPRREAGGGRLVPRAQPELLRPGPHVGLREAGVDEREGGAALGGGPLPGPVVVEVVEVHAEHDGGAPRRRRAARPRPSARPCTSSSGRRRCARRRGCRARRSRPPASACPSSAASAAHSSRSARGQRRRHRGDGERAVGAERVVGHPREEGGVGAAGERDHDRAELAQPARGARSSGGVRHRRPRCGCACCPCPSTRSSRPGCGRPRRSSARGCRRRPACRARRCRRRGSPAPTRGSGSPWCG